MDSFVFYKSFYEAIRYLDPEEYKAAMEAVLSYVFNEEDPDIESQVAKIIFTLIKPQIDANNKRRINGSKGGRPTKTDGYENEKPMVSENDGEEKPNVNVNVNVNDNVNVNGNGNGYKPKRNKKIHNFEGRAYDFKALEREAGSG